MKFQPCNHTPQIFQVIGHRKIKWLRAKRKARIGEGEERFLYSQYVELLTSAFTQKGAQQLLLAEIN